MKKQTIIAAAYLSLIPILIIDKITPPGYVEWILYIIPTIVVALAAGRKASVLFTGICSGFMLLGFYLSPPSILPLRVAIYNRAIGIITLWSVTLLMQLYGRARVKISELVQAKEELKWEKDLLQMIMNSAGKSHLVYLDRDFNFVRVNETYAKTCGYKPEEMAGKNHFDLYPHPENEAIFVRVRNTGVAEEYHDKPFVFPDQPERGTTYWDWTLIPIKDDAGKVLGLVFSLTETTDRKRAEEELRQSESNLARAQAITHLANWEVDIGSNVVRGSQELYRLFELKPGITLDSYTEKFHPDDKMSVMKAINASIHEGQPYHIDYRIVLTSGEIRHVHAQGEVIRDNEARPIRFFGTVQDITERKKAEEKLNRSERLYRAIGESINYGIWVCEPDGRNIYASESFLNLVGITQEQCLNFGWSDVLHPDDAERTIAAWKECVRTGCFWDIEHRFRGVDGQWHPILARGVPVRNEQGEVLCWAGLNLDISSLKKTELSLKERTQQLEAANKELESFSYSVSHDLRAPLRAIDGYSRMLLKKYGPTVSEDAAHLIDVIRGNVKRMGSLIDALLSLAKVQKTDMSVAEIDMDGLAREVWKEIGAANTEHELEFKTAEILPGYGDGTLIRQVLFNLITNAVKFTKDRKPGIIEMSSYREGDKIAYYLRDNGAGFDMVYYDKLFGVFQRLHSNEEYEGTGIGLATVQRIINRHGGQVWAEAKVDEGATFYFSLPLPHTQDVATSEKN